MFGSLSSIISNLSISDLAITTVFYILAAVTIGAAIGVVFLKNIVHAALSLILVFVGVAGIYGLLQADFLAMVQILVYAGAVSIILVFGIMLTRRGNINHSSLFTRFELPALLIVGALFSVLSVLISKTEWHIAQAVPPETTAGTIAELMLTDFVVPFEIAALLLLVAMIGAIVLAKGVKDS